MVMVSIHDIEDDPKILWHVDPLLGNYREISKYATAVTE
jgi:hypothetical protein